MAPLIVLSHIQLKPILSAKMESNWSVIISPDLGLTEVEVRIEVGGVRFPTGEFIDWTDIESIRKSETGCFVVENGVPRKIQVFSEFTNRLCTLMPTEGAPTMLIAGFPMHRIKGADPHQDTLSKIKTISPVGGRVLDTATGLGYTAIEAARTAEQVITIELDPAVLEVAKLNPWSQALLNNPKIVQIIGNSYEKVQEFGDESISRVIHDPPTLSLAGELYSEEFYRQLYRVLRRGGRMFHYVGDPDSKTSRRVCRGVVRRLQEAGFERVRHKREAFGLVATK